MHSLSFRRHDFNIRIYFRSTRLIGLCFEIFVVRVGPHPRLRLVLRHPLPKQNLPHCLTNVFHLVLVPRARVQARANVLNHRLHLSVLVRLHLPTHPPKMSRKQGRPRLTLHARQTE